MNAPPDLRFVFFGGLAATIVAALAGALHWLLLPFSPDLLAAGVVTLALVAAGAGVAWRVWHRSVYDEAKEMFDKYPGLAGWGGVANLDRRAAAHKEFMEDLFGEKRAKELAEEMEKWDKK